MSIYLARQLTDSGLVAMPLGTIFGVLCAAPAYLARSGMPKHPRELQEHACIRLVNSSAPAQWELKSAKSSFQIEPDGPIASDNPDVLLHAAEQASGIILLPSFTVKDSIRSGRLVRVLPSWRSPELTAFALYPSRHFLDAKSKAWLELIRARISPALVEDAAMFGGYDGDAR